MAWLALILGLALWAGLHLMRRVAPAARGALTDRLGEGSKGVIALGLVASIVLMWLGYRALPFIPVWSPPGFLTHINNLLMIFAFYVFLQTTTRPGTAFVMGRIKNPQLTGFKIWALAHLLVNGDLAAIVLFTGLLAWAVAEVVISARTPAHPLVDREAAKITSPWIHLGLTLAATLGVMLVHHWLGVTPWG